jgi:hypothetical protein
MDISSPSSPDNDFMQLESPVEGARNVMVHNIYRPQGTISFISDSTYDSYYFSFFSAAPDISDVFSLPHHTLINAFVDHILLGDFNLYHLLCGGAQATTDTMAENFISFFNAHFLHLLLPQGSITHSEEGHDTAMIWFLHLHP